MSTKAILDRLAGIQTQEHGLLKTLQDLHDERERLLSQLAAASQPQARMEPRPTEDPRPPGRRHKKPLRPLPMGQRIQPALLSELKREIDAMDPDAFQTQGRTFIARWYPKLCKTPAWHELSTALQAKLRVTRQQVAGIAAVVVRTNSMEAVH